ncbi:unnamed protein product, partial [Didymodactylos carnosus]
TALKTANAIANYDVVSSSNRDAKDLTEADDCSETREEVNKYADVLDREIISNVSGATDISCCVAEEYNKPSSMIGDSAVGIISSDAEEINSAFIVNGPAVVSPNTPVKLNRLSDVIDENAVVA